MRLVWILAALLASPTFAGQTWNHHDPTACIGDRDPGDWCTGPGTGGDGKWHVDVSRTQNDWVAACASLLLGRTTKVCGSTKMPIENDEAAAGLLRSACPTEADGLRFPVRREQLADSTFAFGDLALVGDGTYDITAECRATDDPVGCCTDAGMSNGNGQCDGTGVDYDGWPKPQYNDRDDLSFRSEWDGFWLPPFNGQCREALRKGFFKSKLDDAVARGEQKIGLQAQPVPATPDE